MNAALATSLRAGQWQLDASRSTARFAVRNLGVVRVTGTVPITDARVDVDGSGRPTGVRADLDLAGLVTGNPRRDRDLHGRRLLATGDFPGMSFTADSIAATDAGWQVTGCLAARGRETTVVLTAASAEQSADGAIHIDATADFDRRSLGVTAPRVLVGRRVAVAIEAVFRHIVS